jgi:hypothetical protein
MCRDSTAAKINSCTPPAATVSGSGYKPSCPKSSWHFTPGRRQRREPSCPESGIAPVDGEPVHRPIRHDHTLPGEQFLDRYDRQLLLSTFIDLAAADPATDLLLIDQ